MALTERGRSLIPATVSIVLSGWLLSEYAGAPALICVALLLLANFVYYRSVRRNDRDTPGGPTGSAITYSPPAVARPTPKPDPKRASWSPGSHPIPSEAVPAATTTVVNIVRAPTNIAEGAVDHPIEQGPLTMPSDSFVTFVTVPAKDEVFTIRPPAADMLINRTASVIDCWVPAGTTVKAHRYTLSDGLFYFSNGSSDLEPSLVDESLPIGHHDDYRVRQLDYFPTYAGASPDARASYLNWLAVGRRDPQADMGYVYLFFYGLERHAVLEARTNASARAAIPAICAEVDALLSVYGRGRFTARARHLLAYCRHAGHGRRFYLEPPPVTLGAKVDCTLHRSALSQAHDDGEQFPEDWLVAWYFADSRFRTPVAGLRHRTEFEAIFRAEIRTRFAERLTAWRAPVSAQRLSITYTPVSPALARLQHLMQTNIAIADVTSPTAGFDAMVEEIAQTAAEELAPFARHVAKNRKRANDAATRLLLHSALWPSSIRERFAGIVDSVQAPESLSAPTTLAALVDPVQPEDLFERVPYANLIARLEQDYRLGVEPDPRFGSAPPESDTPLVFFQLPPLGSALAVDADGAPSSISSPTSNAYAARVSCVGFFADLIRSARLDSPSAFLRAVLIILGWPGLRPLEYTRLRALLTVMVEHHAPVHSTKTSVRKRVERLGDVDRSDLARELVEICMAGGGLTEIANVRVLEKHFAALGLDQQLLYSLAHTGAASGAVSASEALGAHVARVSDASSSPPSLDLVRIARLREETAAVGAVLGAIFDSEDADTHPTGDTRAAKPTSSSQPAGESGKIPSALPGLDEGHSALLRRLLPRPDWSRAEIAAICAELGLMPDGAIERINEASFDALDEPLLGGNDPIEVNPAAAREVANRDPVACRE